MSWLIGIAIFLLTSGFAKLSTMAVNRLLSFPQSKWLIGLTEVIQISLIPVYVALLTRCVRRGDPHLSFGDLAGEVTSLYPAILIGVGVLGLVLLIRSTIVYQCYRPPNCQIAVESQVIDFRQSNQSGFWRETLVGRRPMRRIALLPSNEQFTVEVSTKTFVLPRLPKQWDGVSIVQFADTHFRGAVTSAWFQAVCQQAFDLKPDLFVFTGDLLDDPRLLDWLPETLGRLTAPLGQYFILGNHDWYLNASEIRREFERQGWIDLAGRSRELPSRTHGPPIIICGDETPWMGTHPDLASESNELFRILLSHTPDNINWAREQGIDLMLAGHTHGGQIRLPLLGPVYSPSRFGCRFASGVFWLDPTLLYVSRGLSGREPIRYHCVPELTKLVLKSCGLQ